MQRHADMPEAQGKRRFLKKLLLVSLLAVIVLSLYLRCGDALTLQNLAQQESKLRAVQQQHPLLEYGVAFVVYVVIAGLSLPGATVLTPIRAWTFWWVRQLGMLAGTAVYVYAGSSVPGLQTLAQQGVNAVFTPTRLTLILLASGLLGVFPLVVRGGIKLFSRGSSSALNNLPVRESPIRTVNPARKTSHDHHHCWGGQSRDSGNIRSTPAQGRT